MKGIITTGEPEKKSSYLRWYLLLAALVVVPVGVVILLWIVRIEVSHPSRNIHAFVAGSNSMCPTVCEHERVLAAMDAYDHARPQKGDVILFRHRDAPALFMKRIAAAEGDSVTFSPQHALRVNGREIQWPATCGSVENLGNRFADPDQFAPITVGQGEFFVVGDNLPSSYDSRVSGFGLVKREDVRGKVLAIYLSSTLARIGCDVK